MQFSLGNYMLKVKPREKAAIISSLGAGVTPRIGLQHIQVGRKKEVDAILKDLSIIQEFGSTIRFIIGDFGSGKTFFLTLANVLAQEKEIVTAKVDISMENSVYATDGKARASYSLIMNSLSTKTHPDGGALTSIIEGWLSNYFEEKDSKKRKERIRKSLLGITKLVSGFDFVEILNRYVDAYIEGDDFTTDACMKWLTGNYRNISAAKSELPGIRSFISDNNYYDYLKLFSNFFELAGYKGFLISIDELAVLTRLPSRTRHSNYETILKIINDSLQGKNRGMMFLIGGTPDFIFSERIGLYSYGALKTRLAKNKYTGENSETISGPIIELGNLKPEELLLVFKNIRNVYSDYNKNNFLIDDEGINLFLDKQYRILAADKFQTPRVAIQDFVGLMNVLQDNPKLSWRELSKKDAKESPPLPKSNFKLK